MKLLSAYKALQALAPAFSTHDAASILNVSPKYASVILSRLCEEGVIIRLAQGRFAYTRELDPLLLPAILSYPGLSYVSLYTALYFHGLIEQIPEVIYAISLTKTKLFKTPLGQVSIHHITHALFTGYEVYGNNGLLMATPEKALFDTLYFAPAKSLRFSTLTEIEFPENFNLALCRNWLNLIQHPGRKSLVEARLNKVVA